jgi:hypothetical protein
MVNVTSFWSFHAKTLKRRVTPAALSFSNRSRANITSKQSLQKRLRFRQRLQSDLYLILLSLYPNSRIPNTLQTTPPSVTMVSCSQPVRHNLRLTQHHSLSESSLRRLTPRTPSSRRRHLRHPVSTTHCAHVSAKRRQRPPAHRQESP